MKTWQLIHALLLLTASAALAQEPASTDTPSDTAEDRLLIAVELQEAQIEEHQSDIAALESRIENTEGLRRDLLVARLDQAHLDLLDSTLRLAREVIDARESDVDVSAYIEGVAAILETLPSDAFEAADHIVVRIDLNVAPESPGDAILADQQLAIDTADVDAIVSDLIDYLEIAPELGIDVVDDQGRVRALVLDAAENRSMFLDLAKREAAKLRVAVTTLPDDADLKARLAATEARVRVASAALGSAITQMNRLGVNTDDYRRMLISSTGEITTDVLDVSVLAGLLADWADRIRDTVSTQGPSMLFSLILAMLIFVLFMQLGRVLQKVVARGLRTKRVRMSSLLKDMILSTVRNVVLIIGVLVALSQIGISLGPLLAGLGIAGFIVGFALQDSLSNFVSGLMILVYRPFDVGDFVEVAGVKGQINAMSLVNTSFLTFDNQKLIVPNNMVWQSVITNYTDQATRRVDLEFGISYGDDIDTAEAVIRDVLAGYDTILEEPAPIIKVSTLGDSSVNLIVRPWVRTEDYWNTYWDLTKLIKQAFDREGITIPFPQRDVHHFGAPAQGSSSD